MSKQRKDESQESNDFRVRAVHWALVALIVALIGVWVWLRTVEKEPNGEAGAGKESRAQAMEASRTGREGGVESQVRPAGGSRRAIPKQREYVPPPEYAYERKRLSMEVREIIDSESRGGVLQTIRDLPRNLNPDEVGALLEHLMTEPDGESDLGYETLRNDLLAKLLFQEVLDARVGDAMQWMVAESETNVTWRDYVVQALPVYFEQAFPKGKPPEANEEAVKQYDKMMETWWGATERRDETTAGTAVMGLYHQMSDIGGKEMEEKICNTSYDLSQDRGALLQSRVAAWQVAASLNDSRALETAMWQAQSGSLALRRTAIATIGLMGSKENLELLRELEASGEAVEGLEPAIAAAIARIETYEEQDKDEENKE